MSATLRRSAATCSSQDRKLDKKSQVSDIRILLHKYIPLPTKRKCTQTLKIPMSKHISSSYKTKLASKTSRMLPVTEQKLICLCS